MSDGLSCSTIISEDTTGWWLFLKTIYLSKTKCVSRCRSMSFPRSWNSCASLLISVFWFIFRTLSDLVKCFRCCRVDRENCCFVIISIEGQSVCLTAVLKHVLLSITDLPKLNSVTVSLNFSILVRNSDNLRFPLSYEISNDYAWEDNVYYLWSDDDCLFEGMSSVDTKNHWRKINSGSVVRGSCRVTINELQVTSCDPSDFHVLSGKENHWSHQYIYMSTSQVITFMKMFH